MAIFLNILKYLKTPKISARDTIGTWGEFQNSPLARPNTCSIIAGSMTVAVDGPLSG